MSPQVRELCRDESFVESVIYALKHGASVADIGKAAKFVQANMEECKRVCFYLRAPDYYWDHLAAHESLSIVLQSELVNKDEKIRPVMVPKLPQPPDEKFIYLMRNERNQLIKIGIAKEPAAREATLQSEEPELVLIWKTRGTLKQEQAIQAHFKDQRVRGEWFRLSGEHIAFITSEGWR